MSQAQLKVAKICIVTDAPAIDWPLFAWVQPLAARGLACTILATKLPQLAWFNNYQIATLTADTVAQMAADFQLDGRSWDIYYFSSIAAAVEFGQHREVNGRLIVQATNFELTVLPHLPEATPNQRARQAVLAQAHRIVVMTDALRETAVAQGVDAQKLVVMPPSVNLDVYQPVTPPTTISPDAVVRLLAVFPLEWESGLEYLLQTIRFATDAGLKLTVDIVGYGSGRQRLYYLLDDFQLFDQVKPVNHLPRDGLREKLQQAHFLMQPSLTDDLSQTVFEALACGLPPLAFAGPNWVETLGDAAEALLSPVRQPEAMADALLALAYQPAVYAALRQQMRQRAVERHDLSQQIAQMETLFVDVLPETAVTFSAKAQPARPTLKAAVASSTNGAEKVAQPDSQLPELALATVAVGEPYARWALAMIESVRENGRFQGPLYVVTDCSQLFAGLENVLVITVPSGLAAMEAKQYKTRLTEWIPAEQILFLDADVVVGRPLLTWYQTVTSQLQNHALLMFPDEGFFGEQYHTGVILMHQQSEPLLTRWRAAIQSGEHARDQAAFMAVAQPDEICLMPDHFLLFPTIETFKRGHHTTFNHITFTGRQRNFSAVVIERYLAQTLQLRQRPLQVGH